MLIICIRVGRATYPSTDANASASNAYAHSHELNNIHKYDDGISKKVQDKYDDATEVVEDQLSVAVMSKKPNSPVVIGKGDSPSSSSPVHFRRSSPSPLEDKEVALSHHGNEHVYQNVAEIHLSPEEPPPNYDELDLFPAHNSPVPNASTSAAMSNLSPRAMVNSRLGSHTPDSNHKVDLELEPPVSSGGHETML